MVWKLHDFLISHLFVAVLSLNKWSVWFSGYVAVPGKAEGHAAVPVCWRPQAQWEGEGRESRGSPAAKLRAVFKTGQGKAEPNGEPSVTLAKVCLLSLLLSNLKLYKKLFCKRCFFKSLDYFVCFRYEKDWSALQSCLERCESISSPDSQFLPVDKLKLDGELLELKVINYIKHETTFTLYFTSRLWHIWMLNILSCK